MGLPHLIQNPSTLSFADLPLKARISPGFRSPPHLYVDPMLRAAATRICLGATFLFGPAANAGAQTIQDPLIARGSLFFRMDPSATTVKGIYGPVGTGDLPLGVSLGLPAIGSTEVPELRPTAERFGALAGMLGTPSIRLGANAARFSADERVLPIQLSYGVLDRLTLGVTVPLIRKRLDTLLRLTPDGADVGQNPLMTASGVVSAFLGDAGATLVTVQTAVDDRCVQLGEQDTQCISGRALVTDAQSFLSKLDTAYQEEGLFPLEGSRLGDGISNRWMGLVTSFADWGAVGPQTLPLASDPLDQATFESLVVAPAWPEGGFPLETPPVVMGLGDVELNVALGLLRPDPPAPVGGEDPGLKVHATAVGTLRFATGSPDSLRTVSPIDPPRGVSGFLLRAVTDLLLPGRFGRFAILSIVEGGWNGTREMTLLAPDPTGVFTPGQTRAEVRWSPGAHIRASITPRFRFGPGLSIGAGWQFLRREPDEFEAVATEGGIDTPSLPPVGEAYSQQRFALELRYTSMNEPVIDAVPFPFEILLRGSKSVTGSEGATVESKAQVMVRFRLRE